MLLAPLVLLSCALALAAATPAAVRTREEVQAFRSYLEGTQTPHGPAMRGGAGGAGGGEWGAEETSGYYDGDLLLDDFIIDGMLQAYAAGRNAYSWPDTHWPNDTVVWEFGEDEFGPLQKAAIEAGIAVIEARSCIKFRYREPEDTAYVRVTGGSGGCYAHVGYWQTRGVHSLNLARNTPGVGCFRHATIVHEWLHILGFLHMQSTHDRDDYVKIVEENLTPGTEHNFDIYGPDLVDNLRVPYDYVSCMHYGPYAFSANGEKTIVALQEHEGEMGQRLYITDYDWLRLNRHYKCPGAWD